jgi:hypothetical protein
MNTTLDHHQHVPRAHRAIAAILATSGLMLLAALLDAADQLAAPLARPAGAFENSTPLGAVAILLNFLALLAFAAAARLFLRWFAALYRDLHARGATLRWAPRWAVAAWFVPALNWVAPVHMLKDAWVALDPATAGLHPRQAATPPAVVWWLGLQLAAGILGASATLTSSPILEFLSFTGWAASGLSLCLYIHTLTRRLRREA